MFSQCGMINMFLQLYMYLALYATTSVANADCEHGFYKEGEMCMPCPPGCTFCTSSDTCNQCNDSSFLSKSTCSPCPSGCQSCNSSNMCFKCKPGFRGQVCEDRCSDVCSDYTCDKDTGYCPCNPGYFGYSCTSKCPETCAACHSHLNCTLCKSGYYGELCPFQCPSGCFKRTCNKSSGNCIKCIDYFVGSKCDKCMPGSYGTLCENKCSVNCATCNSSEYCSICNVGFYGNSCLNQCPDGCLLNSCHMSTGECDFGCTPNFTGPKCEILKTTILDVDANCMGSYGNNCSKSCPVNCKNKLCNQKGHCYSCINGYFGEQCTQQCPSNCLNGSCDKNGTCYSCIDGYYGNGCVLRCPDTCITCVNEYCRTCNNDNLKHMCQLNCANCKLNQSCDFVTGKCVSCKDGFYGRFCNASCDQQCITCSSSGDICTTCKIGWYGIHNDNKTYACDWRCHENCFNRSCYALNGSCNVGCNTGFWGQYCENKCSYKCKDRACLKDNGTCSNACMDGFYGPFCQCPNYCNCSVRSMCDFNCSETCLHNSACRQDNGVCINGCRNGRYDPECENEENAQYCENKCSYKCKDRACHTDNGTCSNACIDGFYGHFCENKKKGFSITVLGLIIASIVIITAVLPACVIVAVKARQHRRATSGEETVVSDGIEIIQQEYEDLIRNQGPVYINLIGTQEENQTTHVYEELTTTMI